LTALLPMCVNGQAIVRCRCGYMVAERHGDDPIGAMRRLEAEARANHRCDVEERATCPDCGARRVVTDETGTGCAGCGWSAGNGEVADRGL
jgi:hypothetical protein